MDKARVVVVVNKWWECDPVMNVLLHANAIPRELKWPATLNHPRHRPPNKNSGRRPRAVFDLEHSTVEVWCLSDLLEKVDQDHQSSSESKAALLPLVRAKKAALTIALGTAGHPDACTHNGCVVIGTKVFMHNFHPNGSNPLSNWTVGPFDEVIGSTLSQPVFESMVDFEHQVVVDIGKRLLPTPLNPAHPPMIMADYHHAALGAVNVTNYDEYPQSDAATLKAYHTLYGKAGAQSLETTHGLIRVHGSDNFIFISGISDRVGYFDEEANSRSYGQNTVAAHNAGIALAWMLPRIDAVAPSLNVSRKDAKAQRQ